MTDNELQDLIQEHKWNRQADRNKGMAAELMQIRSLHRIEDLLEVLVQQTQEALASTQSTPASHELPTKTLQEQVTEANKKEHEWWHQWAKRNTERHTGRLLCRGCSNPWDDCRCHLHNAKERRVNPNREE